MSVDVTIQLTSPDEVDAVNHLLKVPFRPAFPGSAESYLAEFFEASVPDDIAPVLIKQLRKMPKVRAAYIKPKGESPG